MDKPKPLYNTLREQFSETKRAQMSLVEMLWGKNCLSA